MNKIPPVCPMILKTKYGGKNDEKDAPIYPTILQTKDG
jgi:hypothetical protein